MHTVGIGLLRNQEVVLDEKYTVVQPNGSDPLLAYNACIQGLLGCDCLCLIDGDVPAESVMQACIDSAKQHKYHVLVWKTDRTSLLFLTSVCVSVCGGLRTVHVEDYIQRAYVANLVPNVYCELSLLPNNVHLSSETPRLVDTYVLFQRCALHMTWFDPAKDSKLALDAWIAGRIGMCIVFVCGADKYANTPHVKYVRMSGAKWQRILTFVQENRVYVDHVEAGNFHAWPKCSAVPTVVTVGSILGDASPDLFVSLPAKDVVPFCANMQFHTANPHTANPAKTVLSDIAYEVVDCDPIVVWNQASDHPLFVQWVQGGETALRDRVVVAPSEWLAILHVHTLFPNRGIFFTKMASAEYHVEAIVRNATRHAWTTSLTDPWKGLWCSPTLLDALRGEGFEGQGLLARLQLGQALPLQQTTHYFLLYYDENITLYQHPNVTPIRLSQDHPEFFESRGFLQIADIPNTDNIGFLTPSFLKKTKRSLHEICDLTLDANTICGFLFLTHEKTCLERAQWNHGTLFLKLWNYLLDKLGYIHLIGKDFVCSYSNLWVTKRSIAKSYMGFMTHVITTMMGFEGPWKQSLESDSGYNGKLMESNQIVERTGFPHYTFHAFLCERMIGLFAMLHSYTYLDFKTMRRYPTALDVPLPSLSFSESPHVPEHDAMRRAIEASNLGELAKLLADSTAVYPHALSYASYFGKVSVVERLLETSHNVLQYNLSTLFAIQRRNMPLLKLVLEKSEPKLGDQTWFHIAFMQPSPHLAILQTILLSPRAIVSPQYDYVKMALESKQEQIAYMLVQDIRCLEDMDRVRGNFLRACKYGCLHVVAWLGAYLRKHAVYVPLQGAIQMALRTKHQALANLLLREEACIRQVMQAFYKVEVRTKGHSTRRIRVRTGIRETRRLRDIVG
jgi:hypothetical protein